VFRVVKGAGKTAGVPWAGLHTLRHSAATILFRRGWNAVQVQKFLGHHSPAFTLAVYVHLLPDDLPEPDFLDEALGGVMAEEPSEAEADADTKAATVNPWSTRHNSPHGVVAFPAERDSWRRCNRPGMSSASIMLGWCC
jgi:hypothetical protein